jgi:hypothetical protein
LFHQPTPGPAMMRAATHCVELLIAEGCPPQDAFELLRALVALVVGQAVTTHGTRSDFGTRVFLIGAASLLTTSASVRSSPRRGSATGGQTLIEGQLPLVSVMPLGTGERRELGHRQQAFVARSVELAGEIIGRRIG